MKFNAALTAPARVDRGAGRDWPARATIDVTTGLDDAQRAFERCAQGEPAVGFGEIYIQTGYDPSPAPERPPPAERLRAVRALRHGLVDPPRARSRSSSST